MFSLVAFSESQDEAGVFARMAGVPDQHVKVNGDQITVPKLNQLIGSAAYLGTVPGEARFVAPSLRRINPLYITPVEGALLPSADPLYMFHPQNPIPLEVNEALEVENSSDPAAAEVHTVLAMLTDSPAAPITGDIRTINCEVTMAQVVGSWEYSEISFPDSLPVGSYDIVGARLQAAGAIGFRFVPIGAGHRPGGICAQAVSSKDPSHQRLGAMGVWLTFDTTQPPAVELLGSAAAGSATYQLYIDVIKRS